MKQFKDPYFLQHSQLLLNSYRHWMKKDLLAVPRDTFLASELLFKAPFVLVSHGIESDPILNYGNQAALQLWEFSWEDFTQTPSRLTAEPVNQEIRNRLLEAVTQNGFINNYEGIRISSSGKRFKILEAVVWNLLEESGNYCGQAAIFEKWEYLT